MVRKTLTFAAWLLLAAALPLAAQTTTGGITGVVRDAGGGVMPGVTVTATHEATNAVTTAVTQRRRPLRAARPAGRPLLRRGRAARLPEREEHGHRRARQRGCPPRHRAEGGCRHRHRHRQRHGVDRGHHDRNAQDHRRSGAHREPAAQRPQRHAVDDARRRRAARSHRPHVGRDLSRDPAGVVQRRARQHHELRARRRVEQRSLHQRPEPDAEPGRAAGVQRPDQQLQRRVRPERRRDRQCGHPRGHQPVPRPRLRLLPSLQVQRDELLHPGDRRRAEALAVRRHLRRTGRAQPDVLLRVVPGHDPAAPADHPVRPGPDGGDAQRRLLGHRPAAAQSVHRGAVSEQPDSDVALQPGGGEDRQRVAAAAEPGRHRQPADAALRAAAGRRRSAVAGPRRSHLHGQAPDVRAVLGLPRVHAGRAPRRQHPEQRVRPDVAEHGRLDQRHLHPQAEPAEQPGGDVQPDEQQQLPDLSARLLDARHQRLQRRRRRSGSSTSRATSASTAATRIRSCATRSSSSTPCA